MKAENQSHTGVITCQNRPKQILKSDCTKPKRNVLTWSQSARRHYNAPGWHIETNQSFGTAL